MLSNSSTSTTNLTIAGIAEPVVLRYFETLNAGDFEATSALFAANGQMLPPFEQPIEGHKAIATYLKAEAQGMTLYPREGISQLLDNAQAQVQVSGRVQTSWCGVNVSWIFTLNSEQQLLSATIKLLASPQELLSLKR